MGHGEPTETSGVAHKREAWVGFDYSQLDAGDQVLATVRAVSPLGRGETVENTAERAAERPTGS